MCISPSSFLTIFNGHMVFHHSNDLYLSIEIASTIRIPMSNAVMNIIVLNCCAQ